MKIKSYYEIFGLDETATDLELQKIYKELVLKTHPDRYTGSDEEEKKRRQEEFPKLEEAKDKLVSKLSAGEIEELCQAQTEISKLETLQNQ